uniref:Uncharacterized protein n=1 Tax=Saccharum spontaneum TaxID=62335 RepID=A0A678THU1_SACSP|nr:hypothetical protein SS33E24_000002 [Saccharum spontaneum]
MCTPTEDTSYKHKMSLRGLDEEGSRLLLCCRQVRRGIGKHQGSIKWRIAVHVHHSERIPTLPMEHAQFMTVNRQI